MTAVPALTQGQVRSGRHAEIAGPKMPASLFSFSITNGGAKEIYAELVSGFVNRRKKKISDSPYFSSICDTHPIKTRTFMRAKLAHML